MPIPQKRGDEERDTFVSRCIKELSDKDTQMSQEQIIAVCEQQADMSHLGSYTDYIKRIRVRHITKNNDDGTPDMRYKTNKEK